MYKMKINEEKPVFHQSFCPKEIEHEKSIAWEIYSDKKNNIPKRASAMVRIMQMHYERCIPVFERFNSNNKRMILGNIYKKGYQLDIDHYAPHWIFSMMHIFDIDVVNYFMENYYKPIECKYLKKGKTQYDIT